MTTKVKNKIWDFLKQFPGSKTLLIVTAGIILALIIYIITLLLSSR